MPARAAGATRAAAALLAVLPIAILGPPGAFAEPRTLWSLRGGVEDFSLRRTLLPAPHQHSPAAIVSNDVFVVDPDDDSHDEDDDVHGQEDATSASPPISTTSLQDEDPTTTMATTTTASHDDEGSVTTTTTTTDDPPSTTSVALHPGPSPGPGPGVLRTRRSVASGARQQEPVPNMHKVALTQIGYIQFLRYIVEVPELHEFSFCLWLRSKNLTHNHPIFSYSMNEKDRLARAWVSGGTSPRLQLRVRERGVLPEPGVLLAEAAHRRWLHVCLSWDGRSGGRYSLYVDGRLRAAGHSAETAGLSLPGGGDVVVGQEYTDFDKGLDDGIEGEVFGFHLFRTATPEQVQRRSGGGRARRARRGAAAGLGWALGRRQYVLYSPPKGFMKRVPRRVQRLYALCLDPLEAEDRAEAVVAWPATPVRVFGGAIVSNVQGQCGHF